MPRRRGYEVASLVSAAVSLLVLCGIIALALESELCAENARDGLSCMRSAAVKRLVIAGTPKSIAERILEFRDQVGPFGTPLYTGHDWADPALARRSMELAANEVLPLVHRAKSL